MVSSRASRAPRVSRADKLEAILDAIVEQNWGVNQFLQAYLLEKLPNGVGGRSLGQRVSGFARVLSNPIAQRLDCIHWLLIAAEAGM